jgi:hypothetical protein
MKAKATRRMLAALMAVLVLAMAVAPMSYAGEDGGDDGNPATTTSGGSGGSDTGSASGGVAAGAGGMSVAPGSDVTLTELLAGGGVLVLSAAAGLAYWRRGELGADGIGR